MRFFTTFFITKKIRTAIVLLGLCCFSLNSCSPKIPDEVEIVILSTNDLHGNFDHLAKLSVLVKETKAVHQHVIVVDAGDRFNGNPYNDHFETPQFPIVDLLSDIGLEVAVIGNHEFDFGLELLNDRVKDAKYGTIIANVDLKRSGLKGVKPYRILIKDGIKIAFLGLSNVEEQTGKPATLREKVADIDFFDPIKTAMRYRNLRKKSNVFVALTHIGLDEDRILADSMPELDLIIGGHSHTLLTEPEIRNGVMITQGGRYARQVGKTTIVLKKGIIETITNEIVDLTKWTGGEDSAMVEKIRKFKENPFFNEPFVTLQHSIANIEQLTYMITDAQLALPDAQFSAINFSAIRLDSLPAGPVTFGDIFKLSPFNNRLLILPMTPAEIRDFLEDRQCRMTPAGFRFTTKRLSNGKTVIETLMYPNGEELDENRRYNMAIDNFLFSRYLTDYTDRVEETGVFVVDIIVDFLRNNPDIDYRNEPPRVENK